MLNERWINKIFAKFEGRFGSLFHDRWKGCDLLNVKNTWADELAPFADQPERISYALSSIADSTRIPTLPEFIAACRRAPAKEAPKLPFHPTSNNIERQEELLRKAAEKLKPHQRSGIDTHWATHPVGILQLKSIFDAAKRDKRFRVCIDEMVRDGVCTVVGKLLKYWNGSEFVEVIARQVPAS